jgi:hypothetical protein
MSVSGIKKGVLNEIKISDTWKENLRIAISPFNKHNYDVFKKLLDGTSKNKAFVIKLKDILDTLYNIEQDIQYSIIIREQSTLKDRHVESLKELKKFIYKINDRDLCVMLKKLYTHISIDMNILKNVNKMSSTITTAQRDKSSYTTGRF